MAFTTAAQRAAMALMPIADSVVTDQDRYTLAGFVEPNPDSTTSIVKRAGFIGMDSIVYPDGVIRQNDRMIMAGYFPVIDDAKITIETFDLTWNISPGFFRALSSATGVLDAEIAPFSFSWSGATVRPPGTRPIVTMGMRVTMHNNPITGLGHINAEVSGRTKVITDKFAKSYIWDKMYGHTAITDELFFRVTSLSTVTGPEYLQLENGQYFLLESGELGYSLEQSPHQTRPVCFRVKITDYIAAKVRTPGVER